jgi:hypothetical protein
VGLRWRGQILVFLFAMAIVISRRPDVVRHAQFYAEDGAVWFADAYNLGWVHSLRLPAGGYLNTLQRLVAAVALLFPLRYAPLVLNVFGIAIQAAPAWFLLTRRCANWGSLPARGLQAALYLALPNSHEVHVVITNAQFHFALMAFLVAISEPPVNWGWKVFDVFVLLINGLSGPFGIILLPLIVLYWWIRRQGWLLVAAGVVAPAVAIQLGELLFGGYAARATGGHLGATPLLFARILAGQVYLASLIGENSFAMHAGLLKTLLVTIAGSALLVYCMVKGSLPLRLFIVFGLVLFAASLSRPLVASQNPQWEVLTTIKSMRYWFFPMLGVVWSLVWCAVQQRSRVQMAAVVALVVSLYGIRHDWRYPPYKDERFGEYVGKFAAAPAGSVVKIPIFPDGVVMELHKK